MARKIRVAVFLTKELTIELLQIHLQMLFLRSRRVFVSSKKPSLLIVDIMFHFLTRFKGRFFFFTFEQFFFTDRLAQSQLQKTDRVTVISGAVTTIPVGVSPTSGSTSSTASSTSSSTRSAASAASTGSSMGASAGSSSSQGSDGQNNSHSPPMPMNNQSNRANINSSQARLHQDVSRLRVDKLELLRQALSAQHEVRQLRQREAQLETDLALAAAEIRRLKNQLKSAAASTGVGGVHPDSSSQVHLPMVQPSSLMPAAVQQNAKTTSRRIVQMHFPL